MTQGTSMNLTRDAAGNNTFGLAFAPFKYDNTLEATTGEETLTIPGTYKKYSMILSIEPGAEVWVARNATATLPATGGFLPTDSELNPVSREVYADDVIHFITGNNDARVGVVLHPK